MSLKISLDSLAAIFIVGFMLAQHMLSSSVSAFLGVMFILVAMLSWFLSLIKGRDNFSPIDIFLVLFLLAFPVSLLVNFDNYKFTFTPFIWCLGVLVSYFWGGGISRWPKVIAIPGLILAAFFIYRVFLCQPGVSELFSSKFYGEELGWGLNPNRFAVFLNISLISMCLVYADRSRENKCKSLVVKLVSVLLLFCVLASGSRAGFSVSVVLFLFVFIGRFLMMSRVSRVTLRLVMSFGVACLVFFVFTVLGLVINGIVYGSGRDLLWRIALEFWVQRPVLGYGYGQSAGLLESQGISLSFHNAFVQILVEGGVVSLVFFFVFFLFASAKVISDLGNSLLKCSCLVVLGVVIFHQSFEALIFHFSPYSFLFFAFVGWAVKVVNSDNNCSTLA